jgi:hypothetical protein
MRAIRVIDSEGSDTVEVYMTMEESRILLTIASQPMIAAAVVARLTAELRRNTVMDCMANLYYAIKETFRGELNFPIPTYQVTGETPAQVRDLNAVIERVIGVRNLVSSRVAPRPSAMQLGVGRSPVNLDDYLTRNPDNDPEPNDGDREEGED